MHHSHSQTGEPRTGIVSRLESQQGTAATHFLKSQGQALSAGLNHRKAQQPLTFWRGIVRRLETQQGTAATHRLESQEQALVSRLESQQAIAATHILKSQGQALLAGLNHSKPQQPLTDW